MILRRLSVLIIVAAWAAGAEAHGVADFRVRLSQADSLFASSVRVVEEGDAAAIIARLDAESGADKIRGHRICVYSDNSQNARANAESAMTQFRETFPDIPVYLDYQTPYFKVKVGNCVNYEEAITLWGRVKVFFPKAIMTDAVIPIDELKK